MTPLEEFEGILKEVVQAKRLSASKMGKMTDIALKSMEHDTQLVSILYRTHKSLQPSAKVSSLYVFDALARAARHQANKQDVSSDSPIGNCATFLLKVEGVVEGLFSDMVTSGNPECKEKTKKILDIWVKGNTFPTTILSRLEGILKEPEKVSGPEVQPVIPTDPRMAMQSAGSIKSPTATSTPVDPQATLLALLAQAANASVMPNPLQTTANTGTPVDTAQLILLQQLARTASVSNPTQLPVVQPSSAFPIASTGSSSRSPIESRPDEFRNSASKVGKFSGYRSPDHGGHYENRNFSRDRSKGGYRGGGLVDFRKKWDDRDRDRYRDRERDWSPPRGRRSRSRSPPSRYGGRRDVKPYSPPRRPVLSSMRQTDNVLNSSIDHGGKDEFGRDIRPQSPDDSSPPTSHGKSLQPISTTSFDKPMLESSPSLTSNHDQKSLSPSVAANTSSNKPSASFVSSTVSSQPGLDKFDLTTFDFTSPSSWEALGKMWQVTHGYLPSTEQLMEFVMSLAYGQSSAHIQGFNASSNGQTWGDTGDFTMQEEFVHGNARAVQQRGYHGDNEAIAKDVIVLGEDSNSVQPINDGAHEIKENNNQHQNSGGHGGRMQKLGDTGRWVFVRDPVEGIS